MANRYVPPQHYIVPNRRLFAGGALPIQRADLLGRAAIHVKRQTDECRVSVVIIIRHHDQTVVVS